MTEMPLKVPTQGAIALSFCSTVIRAAYGDKPATGNEIADFIDQVPAQFLDNVFETERNVASTVERLVRALSPNLLRMPEP